MALRLRPNLDTPEFQTTDILMRRHLSVSRRGTTVECAPVFNIILPSRAMRESNRASHTSTTCLYFILNANAKMRTILQGGPRIKMWI